MEINLTEDLLAKSVLTTYDCYNLVNELRANETLTDDEQLILSRNEDHIRIMMGKEWFVAVLTDKQITELQAI